MDLNKYFCSHVEFELWSLTNEVNKNEGRGTKIALEASIFKGTCLLLKGVPIYFKVI